MTYRNPVIPGFHPDPSVCRVGNDFFLVASSFTYFPGVPDLPLDEPRGLDPDRQRPRPPVPTRLQRDAGLVVAGHLRPDHPPSRRALLHDHDQRGHHGRDDVLRHERGPGGPVVGSGPVEVPGIDPDLAWDGDGNCWVHFSGLGGIARCRIDPTTGVLLEGPDLTWSGPGLQYPEAPHLYERDGTWYLLIAEGGTQGGHCVSVARGPSPVGPWEGAPPTRSSATAARTARFRTPGTATWWRRRTARGGWSSSACDPGECPPASTSWAARPSSSRCAGGRLARAGRARPWRWRPTRPGRPPDRRRAGTGRDDFDVPALAPHWVGLRRPPGSVSSLAARPGWLALPEVRRRSTRPNRPSSAVASNTTTAGSGPASMPRPPSRPE